MKKPNLIFIIVDAANKPLIDLEGPTAGFCPNLIKLASRGVSFSNFISNGNPTEFAMPSIFSSSLPLDFGGYSLGILRRPANFFEHLKFNGYNTLLLSNSHILDKLYGFHKGFDLVANMYNLEMIWRCMRRTYLWHLVRDRDILGEDIFFFEVTKLIERFYLAIIDYCLSQQHLPKFIKHSKARYKSFNFFSIMERMSVETEKFRINPEQYIITNLKKIQTSGLERFLGINILSARLRESFQFLDRRRIPLTNTSIRTFEKQVSTGTSFKIAREWIRRQNEKPYAVAVHIMDIHDDIYSNNKYLIRPPKLKQSTQSLKGLSWERIKQNMALFYFDRELGKFLETFKQSELDNTVIAITSDHGANTHNGQTPLNSTTLTGSFHDRYLHIPFIISGPRIQHKKINCLGSLIDVAPTICETLEISPEKLFGGKSLWSSPNSEFVVSEHTHRGPCDPINKPIYLCLRSNDFKYIFKEQKSQHDKGPDDLEILVKLEDDILEKENKIDEAANKLLTKKLRGMAKKRILCIKQQAKQMVL